MINCFTIKAFLGDLQFIPNPDFQIQFYFKTITLIQVFKVWYSSVHINKSKLIWGKRFVDFLGKSLSYRQAQYQFSHPLSKSFNMSISYVYFDQHNSWHKTKHDSEPFIWPIGKIFPVENLWKKFPTYNFMNHKDISILLPKTATRAWINSCQFSANFDLATN